MSRSASIDIQVAAVVRQVTQLLRALIESGWSLDDHGVISFLPLGDDGDYEWTSAPHAELERVLSLIDEKEAAGEEIGVGLTWKDGGSGGELRIAGNTLFFSPTIDRRELPNGQGFTDVGWYLQRFLPALTRAGLAVEAVRWAEHV